ncbi:MAG: GAF domain-containing sensor histidine kinase, partial [Actinobacteria bacterium]|nr:GAF domain-containing sensor histidine kinase [Actinomycetota bacterium]
LSSELSLPAVLQRIVELAAEIADARYGALGVIGPGGRIAEFVTTGVTEAERRAVGRLPEGRGILGVLIHDARPLRLADIADDPRSVGFPENHPPMRSFLGAPVSARGRVFGNIYLSEKLGGGEFTEEDEEALVVLAAQAGVAVENAQLYEEARQRERWLDSVGRIATTMLAGGEAEAVLGLIASSARELVGSDLATIALPESPTSLVIQAADGAHAEELRGMSFPRDDSISGDVIRTRRPVMLADVSSDPRAFQPVVRIGGMGPTIMAPLSARGEAFGTLLVSNGKGGRAFGEDDLRLVETFARQAAVALEYARFQREIQRLKVVEDRERIAKELHDGVIQSLFAVGMSLQGTAGLLDDEAMAGRIESAVEEIDHVVRDLRNYIFGLRPGILADRQLDQALRRLAEDFQERSSVAIAVEVDARVAAELSSRAGDVVQLAREALSNVGRHAAASTCRLSLHREDSVAVLEVDDDGTGFDPARVRGGGQGLRNLRERAASLGGSVDVRSAPGEGTTVRIAIPPG